MTMSYVVCPIQKPKVATDGHDQNNNLLYLVKSFR